MEPNAFIGKKEAPTETELADALGKAKKKLWDNVIAQVADIAPTLEWSSYSLKAGWSAKLKKKDRTILYLSPCQNSFRVSFALGDKAIKAAKESGLPEPVQKLIKEAKKYAEGIAVRVDVNTADDVAIVRKLAAIKVTN